jgi:hypothetical protein
MAFLAPALASASALQTASMAFSAFSAVMSIKQGMDTKRAYNAQARQAELEGRVEAVREKERGIQVLANTRKALASVSAIASAGGLEPTIGTPQDIGTSKDNEASAIASASAKARDLRYAGKQAMTGALISAGTSLATASTNLAGIGGPSPLMKTGYTDVMGLGVA